MVQAWSRDYFQACMHAASVSSGTISVASLMGQELDWPIPVVHSDYPCPQAPRSFQHTFEKIGETGDEAT